MEAQPGRYLCLLSSSSCPMRRSIAFKKRKASLLGVPTVGNGTEIGWSEQICSFPWPACVAKAVFAGTDVPSNDSPSAQWHVATGTLLISRTESQAKLKQLAI